MLNKFLRRFGENWCFKIRGV